jgi:hypothetical protein
VSLHHKHNIININTEWDWFTTKLLHIFENVIKSSMHIYDTSTCQDRSRWINEREQLHDILTTYHTLQGYKKGKWNFSLVMFAWRRYFFIYLSSPSLYINADFTLELWYCFLQVKKHHSLCMYIRHGCLFSFMQCHEINYRFSVKLKVSNKS